MDLYKTMEISIDNLEDQSVITLLEEHLEDMYRTSPPESVHALDIERLKSGDIKFWCAREKGRALGCIALKEINEEFAEIKSMRTSKNSRNKGVGAALLKHLLNEALKLGYKKVYLETGSMEFFEPARLLYEKFGFSYCEAFGDYKPDPNSMFMELNL